ncbi:proteasome activator complex subunit 3-like [Oppia nitens]|uniref:proteasome activator complex subunit 3-like n=1 Tax=Oppia nitens TaxID=1686743 RepID=UPI0023DB9583|nr:proteasome activator complex subunit 3-like [Oppia nitens]
MVDILRPQLIELSQYCQSVCVGINLMTPTIEDGNNFGVEEQQKVVEAFTAVDNDLQRRQYDLTGYYQSRTDLMAKAVKYPNFEDSWDAIIERDKHFHNYCRLSLISVFNHYLNLHDLVEKNLKKNQNLRTASDINMY